MAHTQRPSPIAPTKHVCSPHAIADSLLQAVPEQRHLTVQLLRNSTYFLTSVLLITKYGDMVTI